MDKIESAFLSVNDLVQRHDELENFYKSHVKEIQIKNPDRYTLFAYELNVEDPIDTIVIIPGRGEIAHKYYEFLYTLYNLKIKTYILFARGQGPSTKLLKDKTKYYIDDFSNYTRDIDFLIKSLNIADYKLLSFSLGGLISLDLIKNGIFKPKKACLVAPFLWPYFNLNPELLKAYAFICGSLPILNKAFTPGAGPYKKIPFDINYHTHCKERYEYYHDYYAKHPEMTSGGTTYHFVKECLWKQIDIFGNHIDFNIPIYCIISGDDRVVDSNISKVYFNLHKGDSVPPKISVIENAYHDLLNESDEIRIKSLSNSLRFLLSK